MKIPVSTSIKRILMKNMRNNEPNELLSISVNILTRERAITKFIENVEKVVLGPTTHNKNCVSCFSFIITKPS